MAGRWSTTLPDDLILEIGQCFLATNDLDAYVDFRRACSDWHRAIPNPKVDAMDPKFLPSKWVMAKHSVFEDGKVTFVNLSTGRSICKTISHVLRRYFLVGVMTGGLFVLRAKEEPRQIQVLNPFTGAIVHFKAGIPWETVDAVAVTLSPMRVFATCPQSHRVRWIDEDSKKSTSGWNIQDGWGFQDKSFGRSPWYGCLVSMTPFAGDVYTTNSGGSIISATHAAAAEKDQREQLPAILGPESYAQVLRGNYFYLVECQEELLFVIDPRLPYYKGGPLVYKVDPVNKVLVPVWSIGSHALFVSHCRCLSVDASKLQTVQGRSIYYADYSTIMAYDYDTLPDGGWVEAEPEYVVEFERKRGGYCRPFSLAQILVDYCRSGLYSEV